jgi:putative SOS response-associated peptidase YedK
VAPPEALNVCGRFSLNAAPDVLAEIFDLDEAPELAPRYNIAPSQAVPVVRAVDGKRRLELMRWGLVPSWAKDPTVGYRMINARAETAAERPAYRRALRERRCFVIADGFYEWQRRRGGRKQPSFITRRDRRPFAFAGLWERWSDPQRADAAPLLSCTLLTTAPNELVAELHDRMPVILDEADYARWLDPEVRDAEQVKPLLRALPSSELCAFEVSTLVNDVGFDGPECCAPLAPRQPSLF